MTVMVLHIPRTGGMSRVKALDGVPGFKTCPHRMRVSDVSPTDTPVLFVRDPVARFLSAYDHLQKSWVHDIPGQTLLDLWPTARDLALNLGEAWSVIQKQTWVFRPQSWWLGEDEPRTDGTERVTLDQYRKRVASSTRWLFTPQADWLDATRADLILLKTETMDTDLPALVARYGQHIDPPPHINRSRRSDRDADIEAAVSAHYAADFLLWSSAA